MRAVTAHRRWSSVAFWLPLVLTASLAAASPASAGTDQASPDGEIVVVTVNAFQRDLDSARLTQLAEGLASRAGASTSGAHYAPDVVVVQEITESVLVRLRDELNRLMNAQYAIVALSSNDGLNGNVKVKLLMNSSAMTFSGRTSWTDVCDPGRIYQLVTVREDTSSKEVAVAGVHFAPQDNPAGTDACRQNNAVELRKQLAPYDDRGSVVGDFNRRAMTTPYECDPNELSTPMEWYATMTAMKDGHAYRDAVRHYRRSLGLPMANQWTFEKAAAEQLCDGTTGIRRMRLDYVFASDVLAPVEASVDDPGWAGATPGTVGCAPVPECRYSDHRFVWAQLRLPGTVPPAPDTTAPGAPTGLTVSNSVSGQLDLDWADNSEPDLAGYLVERSTDGTTWPSSGTSVSASAYTDTSVTPGTTYFYRVRATDTAGNVGDASAVVSSTPNAPPPPPTVHVGDLDGRSTSTKSGWKASVTVTVHTGDENPIAGATVTYRWSGGKTLTGTCITSSLGSCTATSGSLGRLTSVQLSVTDVSSTAGAYDAKNHDGDVPADSDGTTITVTK